ncbi:MAG: purple acid phosphatase family protein [Candidatus Krumholzibacteriia bacterium]
MAAPADAAPLFPYLQFGGAGGTTAPPPPVVRWFTSPPRAGRVELRDGDAASPWRPGGGSPAGARHAVTLPALAPDRAYAYRVLCDAAAGAPAETSAVFRFTTPPDDPATPFTFIVYGDNRSRPASHRAVTQRMLAGPAPRFIINTGDVVADGPDSLQWHTEFFDPARELFAVAPILVTPGNHEQDRSRRPRELARLWYDNLTLPGNGSATGAGRWWSARTGGCLLIGLDSTAPDAPGQTAWLAATLAAADPRDFVLVFLHHPLWSWGGHGSDPAARAAWGRLLDDRRVDLVFAGHNHFYQRTYPLRAGSATTRRPGRYQAGLGTLYCVAGGGGAPLYTPLGDPRVAAQSETCHFVQLDYAPGSLTCTAIADNGRQLDRFVIEKPAAAAPGR